MLRSAGPLTLGLHATIGANWSRTHTDGIELPSYPFSKEVIHYSFTTVQTNLCGGVGASFDMKVADRIAFRFLQVDYLRNPVAVRYSAGVVATFGSH